MFKLIPLALLQSILLSLAQVFLKLAMMKMPKFAFTKTFLYGFLVNWQFAICGALFTLAGVLWIYIIKHFPFSVAYPMVSLTYVFGMIAAMLFFNENISIIKWIGVTLIVLGCLLIAK